MRRLGKTMTTIWRPVNASNFAVEALMFAFSSTDKRLALSTSGPFMGGMGISAAAAGPTRHRPMNKAMIFLVGEVSAIMSRLTHCFSEFFRQPASRSGQRRASVAENVAFQKIAGEREPIGDIRRRRV